MYFCGRTDHGCFYSYPDFIVSGWTGVVADDVQRGYDVLLEDSVVDPR